MEADTELNVSVLDEVEESIPVPESDVEVENVSWLLELTPLVTSVWLFEPRVV